MCCTGKTVITVATVTSGRDFEAVTTVMTVTMVAIVTSVVAVTTVTVSPAREVPFIDVCGCIDVRYLSHAKNYPFFQPTTTKQIDTAAVIHIFYFYSGQNKIMKQFRRRETTKIAKINVWKPQAEHAKHARAAAAGGDGK